MKILRHFTPILLSLCLAPSAFLIASDVDPGLYHNMWLSCFEPAPALPGTEGSIAIFESSGAIEVNIGATPTDGGIREDVPDKYRARFEKWKTEFLGTEFGREQWDKYANNRQFVLTIKVTGDKGKGAGTDKFVWNDAGEFIGATITLGADLDDGYPTPVYYPVLNSLSTYGSSYTISGKILAASKLSHEIGHVNQAAASNMRALQLQTKLTPLYISIFLKNGLDPKDKKLVDLASQMGGTPTELWESREYLSEINAMLYLRERISKEMFYCHVFNRIRQNLKEYARDYERRFDEYPEYSGSICWK